MFHVPERHRILTHPRLGSTAADGNNGAFELESCEPGWHLFIIASDGGGWEHVSIHSRRRDQMRVPTWREMTFVKGLFWDAEDVAVQYHPRRSEYVNQHPAVLHLWRPVDVDLPTPPPEFVGDLASAPGAWS